MYKILIFIIPFFTLILCSGISWSEDVHNWTGDEIATLRILWIGSLPVLPEDPSNVYSDNLRAASLGKKIFFDDRFSRNSKVSCATCHPDNNNFTDNLPKGQGIGKSRRRTMPLIGVGYNAWFFWDGRKDSLWSQALGPIEEPAEHGFTRTESVELIKRYYRTGYDEVFGRLPALKNMSRSTGLSTDNPESLNAGNNIPVENQEMINRVFANMGKAVAAYVRTIVPGPSHFDRYVEALLGGDREGMQKIYSPDEVRGLKLFIGKANCFNCHNGPLFTDSDFHNIGLPQSLDLPEDRGRADGIPKAIADEFSCRSIYSDAKPEECNRLPYMSIDHDSYKGAFKTPTLRNVAERAPYMHTGQFLTLRSVLKFYRDLRPEQRTRELEHSELSDIELRQLEAFLLTLSGPLKQDRNK